MNINLKSVLMKLLPFLYSAAQRIWFNTPKEQQQQALSAVKFTQVLKENLTALPATVLKKLADALSTSEDAISLSLVALGKVNNLTDTSPEAVIRWAQTKAGSGLSDIGWNLHWDAIAKSMAVILSGNKIDWLSLMLGLLQIALDIFKKG